jgi:nucleoside-diphosphate-sugar epimerase
MEETSMRVLIIGGTKFIGPPMVRRLARSGHKVAVFHRGQSPADLPHGAAEFLGDRDHLPAHAGELRGFAPDVVVDMIAFTEAQGRALVETFTGVARRTVVLSSGDVYRAFGLVRGTESGRPEPMPLAEDAPLRSELYLYRSIAKGPGDFGYHYEKILVERAVTADPALPATILRLPMVYGPGDYLHRLYPYLKRMDDGRRAIPLDEGLARWRCPRGYVDDMAEATALAVLDDRAAGRVYNVSEPGAFTEAEWVRRIGEAVGWDGQVVEVPKGRLPVGLNADQDAYYDTSRIRAELGYREGLPRDEAFRRTVAWERAHPPAEPGLDYAAEDALLEELGRRPA